VKEALYTSAMRIFHGRLRFNKETDEKFRWITSVDGVQFKIYITQDRVPEPIPELIEASVFESETLYTYILQRIGRKTVRELTTTDREDLEKIGLTAEHLRTAGGSSILGAVWNPEEEHTQTVRYNAYRGARDLEFGDPYIPKSILREPYPERLLFLIRWLP
jgi:hypothetical protein